MSPTHRVAVAAAVAALAGPALADAPCAEAARRFCDGKAPAALVSCLQAHRPDLPPACVGRLERVLVFFQSAATACKADAYQFCPKTGPGWPMVDCLRAQEGKLEPTCQQFFDTARDRDLAVAKACGDEADRACPGVSPGRGELWICLGLGGADVSAACLGAL